MNLSRLPEKSTEDNDNSNGESNTDGLLLEHPNAEQGAKVKLHEKLQTDLQEAGDALRQEIGFLPDLADLQIFAGPYGKNSALEGRLNWHRTWVWNYLEIHKNLSQAFTELPEEIQLEFLPRRLAFLDIRASNSAHETRRTIDLDKFAQGAKAAQSLEQLEGVYPADRRMDLAKYWASLEKYDDQDVGQAFKSRCYYLASANMLRGLLEPALRQQIEEVANVLRIAHECARDNGDQRTLADLAELGRMLAAELPHLNINPPVRS